jgi:hypothetical protein
MKLFIVASFLLMAVSTGFQPLFATKMMEAPAKAAAPAKKVVYDPRGGLPPTPAVASKKKMILKQETPKKIETKKPPIQFKNKPPVDKKSPTVSLKKIEKKMVFSVKKEPVVIVRAEKKKTLKFWYNKL